MFQQSLRMLWRDWRAGELRFLLIALVLAVGALSSVGFFIDRISHGFARDANTFLGADLVLSSSIPIPSEVMHVAVGLEQAETISFPSMAMTGLDMESMKSKLVSVKAVSNHYPLHGQVILDTGPAQYRVPEPGTVWVDQSLLTALETSIGQSLKLGEATFTISHVIKNEPDRGSLYLSFAPRVMLSMEDVFKTGLIQPTSRVIYKLMLAGDSEVIQEREVLINQVIKSQSLEGITIDSLQTSRPEMYDILYKTQQFLSLVSLLSAMLAALAVALVSRRFMLRQINAYGMFCCLGMKQNQVTILYVTELIIVGLVAGVLGVMLGYVSHLALLIWLKDWLPNVSSSMPLAPAVQGILMGLLLLIGFAMPPILQLREVPYNLMSRRVFNLPRAHTLWTYLLGGVMFVLLLVWRVPNIQLASYLFLAFLGGVVLFAGFAWLFLYALRFIRTWLPVSVWGVAIYSLQRRPMATILQIVSLAIGLMALLLLTIVRNDLLHAWHQATPPDAPNQFVMNILPDQQKLVHDSFIQQGLSAPVLYPVMRGRLIAINNHTVTAAEYTAQNAKRLIEREFNLSTMKTMQSYNQLIAGRWFNMHAPFGEASVEEGIAKTFHINLGDVLHFDVAGEDISVKVTSIRKLSWDSMRVNFFVIIDPHTAQALPKTWITAFHLPNRKSTFINKLTQTFPNLTIIDTGMILSQVQRMLDQVSQAVRFLFLFTLVSGLLVVYATVKHSQNERMRETSLLRALGASQKQLSAIQWIEYALLGGVSGLLASCGAAIIGWVLARQVFDFLFEPSWLLWLAGLALGMLCALLGGWFGLRHILNQPPLLSLREG